MSRAEAGRSPSGRGAASCTDGLAGFLVARLTEDLARIWERDAARASTAAAPGMAAQVAVIDDLLVTLRSGRLPCRRELRMLLYGYGAHPAYDPAWVAVLDPPG